MLTEKFTLLELTDLALKFPEAGTVNFNILHTVLYNLILKLELNEIKVPCFVEDEALAQVCITQNRLKKGIKRNLEPATVEEMRQRMKDVEEKQSAEEKEDEGKEAEEKKEGGALAELDIDTGEIKISRVEDLLEKPSLNVMVDVWRATNINRRMDAAEVSIGQLSTLIDDMLDKIFDIEESNEDIKSKAKFIGELSKWFGKMKDLEDLCKLLAMRIDETNEIRRSEIARLEEMIKRDQEYAKSAIEALEKFNEDLSQKVAYKSDLDELREEMSEDLEKSIKDIKKIIREVEESSVKKHEFEEVMVRIEHLEDDKVGREELGRLLEPGFIDSFLNEQSNLRVELDELKVKVTEVDENLEAVKTMIEVDVIKRMDKSFEEIHSTLDKMNAKLSLLDPDEINDTFADLEEQVEKLLRDLDETKLCFEQLQKESKIHFNKISNVNEWLTRLEEFKVDKIKMSEMLEKKADLDLIMSKVDRNEFTLVVGDVKNDMERLAISLKINEEEMNENFTSVRHELALKMYTEDFIVATEPIRNRIKALIYELKRVKEIALTHLFPDAPGISKCISCNRGAHLAGPKYAGDANISIPENISPESHVRIAYDKSSKTTTDSGENSGLSLPLSDLDSVPFPPADKPREKDPRRLPVLLATARPNIGLEHEMRRSTIDKKLAAYFAKKPVRPIDGEYTCTQPQQRGVSFTEFKLTPAKKEEVLLKGIDKSIYRGSVPEEYKEEVEENVEKTAEPEKKQSDIKRPHPKTSGKHDIVIPTPISLHVDGEPLQKTVTLPRIHHQVSLPSIQNDQKTSK